MEVNVREVFEGVELV